MASQKGVHVVHEWEKGNTKSYMIILFSACVRVREYDIYRALFPKSLQYNDIILSMVVVPPL